MIPLLLWSMRWRLLLVAALCVFFYFFEPGFHQHGDEGGEILNEELLDPAGIAFSLANLAAASMLVLLAGFVSGDRRKGYYRIFFSHPTRPSAFYGLRWGLAFALTMAVVSLFLVFGQLAAWGELQVGPMVLLQAALFALVYGGLIAFLSVLLPRGDALAALVIFFLTDWWFLLTGQLGAQPLPLPLQQAVSFILPPHVAVSDVFSGMLAGAVPWGAVAFAAGYGVFWLAAAWLLLRVREWP